MVALLPGLVHFSSLIMAQFALLAGINSSAAKAGVVLGRGLPRSALMSQFALLAGLSSAAAKACVILLICHNSPYWQGLEGQLPGLVKFSLIMAQFALLTGLGGSSAAKACAYLFFYHGTVCSTGRDQ